MTFLTTRYHITQAITPRELEQLRRLMTAYGIRGVSLEGERLMIEYDASRICEAELLALLRKGGILVTREEEIPLPQHSRG